MFWPCFYTVLTTIVAFASLIISDIKPIIDFGYIMILSLCVIFICSFSILPLLISYFPNPKNSASLKLNILNFFYNFSSNHGFKILSINIIFFLISVYGIFQLNVENSFINYFKKNTEIYEGMRLIDTELGGTTPIDIIVSFKNTDEQIIEDEISIINDDSIYDEDLILDEEFISDGVNRIKSLMKTENVLFDIKSIFEKSESDIRL